MAKVALAPYGAAEHRAALARGKRTRTLPTAVIHAHYDREHNRLGLQLKNGVSIDLPIESIRELRGHHPRDLAQVTVSPGRDGLIWDCIDVAISAPGLLTDLFGSALRSKLGGIGGRRTSPAKANAARSNGAKGGRPRRTPAKAITGTSE